MQIIKNDQIANAVFEAVQDSDLFLPVGEKLSLEHLSISDDGIFPSRRSWESFVRGNFLWGDNEFVDSPKESTIKRWCYPAKDYMHKFVTPIGGGDYVLIDPTNIELSYDYEWYTGRNARDGFACTSIEIFVTAKVKE